MTSRQALTLTLLAVLVLSAIFRTPAHTDPIRISYRSINGENVESQNCESPSGRYQAEMRPLQ